MQGILFLIAGFANKLQFRFRGDPYGIAGMVLIVYAIVIYPLLGAMLGHSYPNSPVFGVAPCPTTIFTFGLLLWTSNQVPGWLLVIPGLWAAIGFTAALRLGICEDIGLLVAGAIGVTMLLYPNHLRKKAY